jgi:hypothetical protein
MIHLHKLLEHKKDVTKLLPDGELKDRVSLCGLLHERVTLTSLDYHKQINEENIINETGDTSHDFDDIEFISHDFLCDFRFCPVCNAYKSQHLQKQIYKQLKAIIDKEHKHIFFMTLTVPNCSVDDIAITLDKFQTAYKTFRRHPQIAQFKSFVRTLEITFNDKNESHPHYHIIFLADKYYFSKKNKNYIYLANGDLKQLWASHFLKDKENHINVDFRKATKREGFKDEISSVISELAKYMTKSADLKNLTEDDFVKVIAQLHGKRNISTSKDISLKKLKFSKARETLYKEQRELKQYARVDKVKKPAREYLKSDYGCFPVSSSHEKHILNIYENAEGVKAKYKSYDNYAYTCAEMILLKYPKLNRLIKSRKK